jgi:hypothetical protein
MRSIILSGVILGVLFAAIANAEAASCGCGGGSACGCGGSGCDGNACQSQSNCPCSDSDCLGDCGYPYRWRPGVRAACDPCAECGPCRPMTCHDKTYCGPLTPLFALFTRNSWCGTGCGERYWGDFYGDPPDWCDPCDRCGNFTGGCNSCGDSVGQSGRYVSGSSMARQRYNSGPSMAKQRYVSGPSMAQRSMPYDGQVIPANAKIVSKNDRVIGQVPTPASKQRKTTR